MFSARDGQVAVDVDDRDFAFGTRCAVGDDSGLRPVIDDARGRLVWRLAPALADLRCPGRAFLARLDLNTRLTLPRRLAPVAACANSAAATATTVNTRTMQQWPSDASVLRL